MSDVFTNYGIEEAVFSTLSVPDQASAIREMVRELTVGKGIGRDDRIRMFYQVLQREVLGSTGIGCGVAVPHTRCQGLDRPLVGWFIADPPVDFLSLDNEPVRFFCCYIWPVNDYGGSLRLLEGISFFCNWLGDEFPRILLIDELKDLLHHNKDKDRSDWDWPGSGPIREETVERTSKRMMHRAAAMERIRVAEESALDPKTEEASFFAAMQRLGIAEDAEKEVRGRLESVVRDVAGSMLRSLDVRVRGQIVEVHARASRFRHRAEVRRRLESLAELAGAKIYVE
jgi:nitrogen PTS system EIIA component